jgi:hypothetical protein
MLGDAEQVEQPFRIEAGVQNQASRQIVISVSDIILADHNRKRREEWVATSI